MDFDVGPGFAFVRVEIGDDRPRARQPARYVRFSEKEKGASASPTGCKWRRGTYRSSAASHHRRRSFARHTIAICSSPPQGEPEFLVTALRLVTCQLPRRISSFALLANSILNLQCDKFEPSRDLLLRNCQLLKSLRPIGTLQGTRM